MWSKQEREQSVVHLAICNCVSASVSNYVNKAILPTVPPRHPLWQRCSRKLIFGPDVCAGWRFQLISCECDWEKGNQRNWSFFIGGPQKTEKSRHGKSHCPLSFEWLHLFGAFFLLNSFYFCFLQVHFSSVSSPFFPVFRIQRIFRLFRESNASLSKSVFQLSCRVDKVRVAKCKNKFLQRW